MAVSTFKKAAEASFGDAFVNAEAILESFPVRLVSDGTFVPFSAEPDFDYYMTIVTKSSESAITVPMVKSVSRTWVKNNVLTGSTLTLDITFDFTGTAIFDLGHNSTETFDGVLLDGVEGIVSVRKVPRPASATVAEGASILQEYTSGEVVASYPLVSNAFKIVREPTGVSSAFNKEHIGAVNGKIFATPLFADTTAVISSADDGLTWELDAAATALGITQPIFHEVNNYLVAFNGSNTNTSTYHYTSDGITWTVGDFGVADDFGKPAYADGNYFFPADGTAYLTATDIAGPWTSGTTSSSNESDITFVAEGHFVTGGVDASNFSYAPTDLSSAFVTWVTFSAINDLVYGSAFGGNVYLRVTDTVSTISYAETLGGAWTNTATFPVAGVRVIEYFGGTFLAIGSDYKLYKMTSLTSWELVTGGNFDSYQFNKMVISDGKLFVFGLYTANDVYVAETSDGITWSHDVASYIYANNSAELIATSSGSSLVEATNNVIATRRTVADVEDSNFNLLIVSDDNGETWDVVDTSTFPFDPFASWNYISAGQNVFMITVGDGQYYKSSDFKTWTSMTMAVQFDIPDAARPGFKSLVIDGVEKWLSLGRTADTVSPFRANWSDDDGETWNATPTIGTSRWDFSDARINSANIFVIPRTTTLEAFRPNSDFNLGGSWRSHTFTATNNLAMEFAYPLIGNYALTRSGWLWLGSTGIKDIGSVSGKPAAIDQRTDIGLTNNIGFYLSANAASVTTFDTATGVLDGGQLVAYQVENNPEVGSINVINLQDLKKYKISVGQVIS